jgi:hypothetical protein
VGRGDRACCRSSTSTTTPELAALRDKVVLFLAEKGVVGAQDFEVTPLMRVVIAIQACVLVLHLEPDAYAGWSNVVVYPDEFRPKIEYEDEHGVVHTRDHEIAGEAWDGGPVLPFVGRRRALARLRSGGNEPGHPRVRAQARHEKRRRRRHSGAARGNADR